jgi:hypothetical protein
VKTGHASSQHQPDGGLLDNIRSPCLAVEASLDRKETELLAAYATIAELKVELARTQSDLSLCILTSPLAMQPSSATPGSANKMADRGVRGGGMTQYRRGRGIEGDVATPVAGQPRTLMQAEADAARPCSKTEVDAVLNAGEDRTAVVVGMFATNAGCASCIVPCGAAPGLMDAVKCMLRCHHQNENMCGAADLARIKHLLPSATLDDRQALLRMLELAEANCAYCIVSTYEHVCGEGCIDRVFHLFTDFPVIPHPCLPELATRLASEQAAATRGALRAVSPFGLTVPTQACATDIYAAAGEPFGEWPVFKGLHRKKYMFHCDATSSPGDVWALSSTDDRDAWGRCEAELWVSLDDGQVRTALGDPSSLMGGVHFDFGVAECRRQINAFGVNAGSATAQLTPDPPEQKSETVTFAVGVTPSDVACDFMLRFGPHNVAARTAPMVLRLPTMSEPIELVSDILVREGEFLRIESPPTTPATLTLHSHRVRVESGGRLEMHALTLADSKGVRPSSPQAGR